MREAVDVLNIKTLLFLLALSACSSTPDSTPPPAPGPTFVTPTAPNYVTMDDTRYILVPITGDMVSYIYRSGSGALGRILGFNPTSGTYSPSDGALTISIGDFQFTDTDGPGINNLLRQGNFSGGLNSLGAGYQYVRFLNLNGYQINAGYTQYWSGLVGVATNVSDVPTAGSATFVGGAEANLRPYGYTWTLFGNTTLTADFAAGSADVTMVFNDSIDNYAGTPLFNLPITQVNGTGMIISGNTLSGGNWTAIDWQGYNVDLLSKTTFPYNSPPPVEANATFYGFDPVTVGPAEVAGIVTVDGSFGHTVGSSGEAEYYFWALRQP